MGMAASQARFLGLTARKSNVEYQGQQVNQQRTSLSNESANLYNEMMDLNVPTPPSTSDYYKTTYTLDNSSDSYATEDYTISNVVKTYNAEGQYLITLNSKTSQTAATNTSYKIQYTKPTETGEVKYQQKEQDGKLIYQGVNDNKEPLYHMIDEDGNKLYYTDESQSATQTEPTDFPATSTEVNDYPYETSEVSDYPIWATDENGNKIIESDTRRNRYDITLSNSTSNLNLVYDSGDNNAYTGENGSLLINKNQIYALDDDKKADLKGYNECVKEDSDIAFFYQDDSGVNHFLTQAELDAMTNGDTNKTINPEYTYTYTKEVSTQVTGYLETSSSTDRFSTITIEQNDSYPENLNNKTFSLSCTQVYDEHAYNDAYNDYEFEKTTYEKTLSDLNAKTEILQEQDQKLELKLKQLDTEENALKTEMDSVKEVLKANVESTFKTFA